MKPALFIIFPILLSACVGTNKTPRQQFVDKHYADVVKLQKKLSREEMEKWPRDKLTAYIITLQKIGVYDVNAKDQTKVLTDYIARTQKKKDGRIAEIKKSKEKRQHFREDIERAVDKCGEVATEVRLYPIVEADGDDVFFAKNSMRFEILSAMNGALCACIMVKIAPKFTPETIKDYVKYVENGQFMMAKYTGYSKFTGDSDGAAMNFIFYNMAGVFNALDGDADRVMEANVFDYFLSQDDEQCLKEIVDKMKEKPKAAK